jgi:signal transduction histidine kinase
MDVPGVLIIDDDPSLLQALPQTLYLRMRDIEVATCDSVQTALVLIQERDYDAIVSDIKMPGMDGLELLERVRELRPDTPVLLITGHGDYDLAVRALRGGAYDYIQKPIDRDSFIAALQRAIQTRQLRRRVTEQHVALALHARSLEQLVERRTSELVQANAIKDKFLKVVSHELQAPLTNLIGMTQLLSQQLEHAENTETVKRGLHEMEHALQRTAVLVQDLLDTSLMGTNMFVLNRKRCNLVELCRNVLREYAAGAGPTLASETLGDPVEAEVDSDRITEVLMNLLSNARKFSPKGSPITVTVRRSGYEAIIAVHDEGIGIPAEALPHIFEQFYRVPGTHIQDGVRAGQGLGLYVAHKIVERHGGHIEVQSVPGEGSVFSVVLPLCIDQAAGSTNGAEQAPHAQSVWTIIH